MTELTENLDGFFVSHFLHDEDDDEDLHLAALQLKGLTLTEFDWRRRRQESWRKETPI